MTVGGMGFIPERLLMMMMMIYIFADQKSVPYTVPVMCKQCSCKLTVIYVFTGAKSQMGC